MSAIAAGPGFEPRYQPPEGRGLPLADPAIINIFETVAK